jgi:hypothetical protein
MCSSFPDTHLSAIPAAQAEGSGQASEATTSGVPLLPNMDPVALAEALGVHRTEEGGK